MIIETIIGVISVIADLFDGVNVEGLDSGYDIHGNPSDVDIWGNRPSDVQGNAIGNDVWGNANNRPWHG